jgi:hypothetical protein
MSYGEQGQENPQEVSTPMESNCWIIARPLATFVPTQPHRVAGLFAGWRRSYHQDFFASLTAEEVSWRSWHLQGNYCGDCVANAAVAALNYVNEADGRKVVVTADSIGTLAAISARTTLEFNDVHIVPAVTGNFMAPNVWGLGMPPTYRPFPEDESVEVGETGLRLCALLELLRPSQEKGPIEVHEDSQLSNEENRVVAISNYKNPGTAREITDLLYAAQQWNRLRPLRHVTVDVRQISCAPGRDWDLPDVINAIDSEPASTKANIRAVMGIGEPVIADRFGAIRGLAARLRVPMSFEDLAPLERSPGAEMGTVCFGFSRLDAWDAAGGTALDIVLRNRYPAASTLPPFEGFIRTGDRIGMGAARGLRVRLATEDFETTTG